ncbi:PhzF family isomerase [Maribellus comscasis]|uniref:PhzF family isomerase n=2 Tax=Maribellus comscasis TaxID=2681766 RepID=A0A6I6K474_9BACT|nr:PhzF family isomerase [Maribellus comscasis]
MKEFKIYQIDSFTKERFKGNPAGVVINADGLSDNQMQKIARELNNSETAFLFSPDSKDCDGVIRYFTPQIEVPTCGHATIAAMYAKALEEHLDSCILRIKTKIGILPFEIVKENGDYKVIMTQGRFELSPTFNSETTNKLIAALGLAKSDLDNKCPVQIASTGHSKVMIGIKDREKLNDLSPDFNDLASLSKSINCNGYFVFTFDSDIPEVLTYGRMFAPAVGINEDPVTGNANGPLGGYLIQNRIVEYADNKFEFNGCQGERIDRMGKVNVKVKIENTLPVLIQIMGDAVEVFQTEIKIG